MRLINTETLGIEWKAYGQTQSYAILSHRWGKYELTLQDMENCIWENETPSQDESKMEAFEKVKQCCAQARADGFTHIWMDTCCIDKTSSAELSEAINSMYLWYSEADRCYAYLADVPSKATIEGSEWFTRGWTLQELLAPSEVHFHDENWNNLGTKESLQQIISNRTGIPLGILSGDDLETASIAQRMSWAAARHTTRVEDRAYCLMGIFGVNMPLLYGEGERAFIRLQEEIMRMSEDQSLFAWRSPENTGGLLATSPAAFINSSNIIQFNPLDTPTSPLIVNSTGVHVQVRFIGRGPGGLGLAVLHCKERNGDKPIAIYVRDSSLTMIQFARVRSDNFEHVDLGKLKRSQYPLRSICIRTGRMSITRSKHRRKCDTTLQQETLDEIIKPDSFLKPNELLRAAQTGNKDNVWLLLTRTDVNINMKDNKGLTALWHAALGSHEAVVKMLLARSECQPDSKDGSGRSLLSWAAEIGNHAVVKLLINSDRVNLDSADNKNKQTPLWHAVKHKHESVVKLLLDRDADVEVRDQHNRTPLWLAIHQGNEAITRLLLSHGSNIEQTDKDRRTPLAWAAGRGHKAVVELLLGEGANIEAKDAFGQTPLWCAGWAKHEAVLELLLDRGAKIESRDSSRQTLLCWAADKGHEKTVKLLLERGASFQARDKRGRTPLWSALLNKNEPMVKLLLDHGVDVEMNNTCDETPLCWAAEEGSKTIVKLLLEKGANVEADGVETPLWCAAQQGHAGVVKMLLDKGANVETHPVTSSTPLWLAIGDGHEEVVKVLLDHGADFETVDRHSRRTPAWLASEKGNQTIINLLLGKGAVFDVANSSTNQASRWKAARKKFKAVAQRR